MEISQNAGTVPDLMQAFDTDEACKSPRLKDGKNICGTPCESEPVLVLAHQVVNKVYLLQRVIDCP